MPIVVKLRKIPRFVVIPFAVPNEPADPPGVPELEPPAPPVLVTAFLTSADWFEAATPVPPEYPGPVLLPCPPCVPATFAKYPTVAAAPAPPAVNDPVFAPLLPLFPLFLMIPPDELLSVPFTKIRNPAVIKMLVTDRLL